MFSNLVNKIILIFRFIMEKKNIFSSRGQQILALAKQKNKALERSENAVSISQPQYQLAKSKESGTAKTAERVLTPASKCPETGQEVVIKDNIHAIDKVSETAKANDDVIPCGHQHAVTTEGTLIFNSVADVEQEKIVNNTSEITETADIASVQLSDVVPHLDQCGSFGENITNMNVMTFHTLQTINVENNVSETATAAEDVFTQMCNLPVTEQEMITDDSITDMILDLATIHGSNENIIQVADNFVPSENNNTDSNEELVIQHHTTPISGQGSASHMSTPTLSFVDNCVALEVEVPFHDNGIQSNEETVMQYNIPPASNPNNAEQNTKAPILLSNKNSAIERCNTENLDHDYNTISCKRNRVPIRKRKVTQEHRLHGEQYIGYKRTPDGKVFHQSQKPARSVKPRCHHTTPKKITERSFQCACISEESRKAEFQKFWELESWVAKKAYIKGLVSTKEPGRRRKDSQKCVKLESHDCFLPKSNGEKVRVCQSFFLATLSIGADSFKRWVRDDNLHGNINRSTEGISLPGKENARTKYKLRRQSVIDWLDEIPKVPSHYCRSTSQRVYVESTFRSKVHMHTVYESWCREHHHQPVSRQIFCQILEEKKISIHSPRKDQCDTCFSYKVGQLDEEVYAAHREKEKEARDAKQMAKESANENKLVVTMDLQSVLLAPNLQASALYYKSKLQVHNFTFYSLNNGDVVLYVWHEGNGGVGSNEFVSCITDYIQTADREFHHITLISDGCTYQNRNKILSSALSDLSKKTGILIEQLILEKGHTMMEADSVHSTLENIFVPPIYAPSDYIAQMKLARPHKPYNVKVLDYTFFKRFDSMESNFKSIRPGQHAVVTDIRALLYKPSGHVAYKLKHTEEYQDLPQHRSSALKDNSTKSIPVLYQHPLKIKKEKYKHLQQLKAVIPAEYHPFYDSLSHD